MDERNPHTHRLPTNTRRIGSARTLLIFITTFSDVLLYMWEAKVVATDVDHLATTIEIVLCGVDVGVPM